MCLWVTGSKLVDSVLSSQLLVYERVTSYWHPLADSGIEMCTLYFGVKINSHPPPKKKRENISQQGET